MIHEPIRRHGETSTDPVLEGVRDVLRTHLAVAGPVEPSADLTQELQIDSLGQLTLVVELENHFRICIDPEDEQGIETVGDLVSAIRRQLAQEARPHA